MRVSPISHSIYCKSQKSSKQTCTPNPQPQSNIAFKKTTDKIAVGLCGGLCSIAGGIIGLCIGGPLGAIAGAALVGGAGAKAQQAEIDYKKENPNSNYYEGGDISYYP